MKDKILKIIDYMIDQETNKSFGKPYPSMHDHKKEVLIKLRKKVSRVELPVILPKANQQIFTFEDLKKAYNDGYKNGIMNEAGLECEPFDVWYNWVHKIKSKNQSEP